MFKQELLTNSMYVKCETPKQREQFIKWCEKNNNDKFCNYERRVAEGSMKEVGFMVRAGKGGEEFAWYFSTRSPSTRKHITFSQAIAEPVFEKDSK